MPADLSKLPETLPVPVDDGATDHLPARPLPDIELRSTDGSFVNLSKIKGRCIIYVYPMTGIPGTPLPEGWDELPGARGCTPQACRFRDHFEELTALNTGIYGVSTQTSDYQSQARDRLHLPFQLLSDDKLILKELLDLPTFRINGMDFYKRLTMIVNDGEIEKVFYPVFPPDQNADEVVVWLKTGSKKP